MKPLNEICISLGDPSGISPEVLFGFLLKADTLRCSEVVSRWEQSEVVLRVFGSVDILRMLLKKYDLPLEMGDDYIQPLNSPNFRMLLTDVPYGDIGNFRMGQICEGSATNSYATLETVCEYISKDMSRALVTLPLNKEAIGRHHKDFTGHTEFLGKYFKSEDVMMCFFSPEFSLSLMTTHIPLSEVSKVIHNEVFLKVKIEKAYDFRKLIASDKPLLVLGLNPHAGEHGKIGHEDMLMERVIGEFHSRGYDVVGPVPADSAFVDVRSGKFDHVLACYHDQGLIPLKMLSKGRSVNYSHGLPFVRTSVDHGTAYDIAGTMKAQWQSFHYALKKAYELMSLPRR